MKLTTYSTTGNIPVERFGSWLNGWATGTTKYVPSLFTLNSLHHNYPSSMYIQNTWEPVSHLKRLDKWKQYVQRHLTTDQQSAFSIPFTFYHFPFIPLSFRPEPIAKSQAMQ